MSQQHEMITISKEELSQKLIEVTHRNLKKSCAELDRLEKEKDKALDDKKQMMIRLRNVIQKCEQQQKRLNDEKVCIATSHDRYGSSYLYDSNIMKSDSSVSNRDIQQTESNHPIEMRVRVSPEDMERATKSFVSFKTRLLSIA